jgi:hypothetical protein
VWEKGLQKTLKKNKFWGNELDRTWNILENNENKFFCLVPRPLKIRAEISSIEKKLVDPGGYCFMAITTNYTKPIYTCFNYEIINDDFDNEQIINYIIEKKNNVDYICIIRNYEPDNININKLYKIYFSIVYEKVDHAYCLKTPNINFYKNICVKQFKKEYDFEQIYKNLC